MESEACQYCGMSGVHSPECPTQSKAAEEEIGRKEIERMKSDLEKAEGETFIKYNEHGEEEEYTVAAEYKVDKGAKRPRLEFAKEQVEDARGEMDYEYANSEEGRRETARQHEEAQKRVAEDKEKSEQESKQRREISQKRKQDIFLKILTDEMTIEEAKESLHSELDGLKKKLETLNQAEKKDYKEIDNTNEDIRNLSGIMEYLKENLDTLYRDIKLDGREEVLKNLKEGKY